MNFILTPNQKHILILGAGASVDYGLPTWIKLGDLIEDKIKNGQYNHKKEILDWLDKIGDNKKYKTIDECIKFESVSNNYHANGDEIENEIFTVIRDIFEEVYIENDRGWIRTLNEKIKNNEGAMLENKIVFINYNYDDILDRNFLNFDYLPTKHKRYNYQVRLGELFNIAANCLCPHGNFPSEVNPSRINNVFKTMKSNQAEHIDAVSCYESDKHVVTQQAYKNRVLYILGLGSGLEINLNNINFDCKISEIHITIKNENIKKKAINYLAEKFNIDSTEIKIYKDCRDLVNNCFN